MLQSPIDFAPFELTLEEKIYRSLKRLGVVFATGAVALAFLDLTNVHSVDAAAEFLHDSNARLAALPDRVSDLPERIRSEIRNISVVPATMNADYSAQVAVAIPRDEAKSTLVLASLANDAPLADSERESTSAVAKLTQVSPVAETAIASPVAALAAARQQDAVEMAMMPPAPQAASWQPSAATIALASANETDTPSSGSIAPTPVSLPMADAIPLDMVPMPRPAPGAPPPSPAERLHLVGKDYAKAERSLANAVYFESRSEPVRGQMAVAQVVMNRVFSGFYPHDVCAVVYQNADHHLACQFTFACDGKRKLINERGAWARANRIAKETLDGVIYVPEVAKSTHYHAVYVHPNWVREMHRLVRYGLHAFYRPIAWGNGAEEPVWGTAALAQDKSKAK